MTSDTEQNQGISPVIQEQVTNPGDETQQQLDERALLMQRARMMGLNISNNIGLDTLKQRIQDHLDGNTTKKETPLLKDPAIKDTGKNKSLRQHLMEDAMKLVRIRITNLDPKKKDLQGEIITVANEYIGTVKKFVPFGEVTDNGYHVPNVIYKALKRRKFLNIRTRKGPNGQIHVEQNWAQEFAIEVLPPLTAEELQQLATAQLAAGTLN